MSSHHIPRHAFACTPTTAAYVDDFPPWAPVLQTLPTDVDAASSVWIEPLGEERAHRVPWLDDVLLEFDANLLATLALDEQLLYFPEEAFADVCWAAAVLEPEPESPRASIQERLMASPLSSHAELENEDNDVDDVDFTPAPPYMAPTFSAVDEHNRLVGTPFAESFSRDFAPLRRRDVVAKYNDPMRIDPFPRDLQPNTSLDAAAALLMLQPSPQSFWQVSGTVGVGTGDGMPIGAYPIRSTPKASSRFLAYLTSRPHSPPPPVRV
ncbi:hypothetical protein MIND_00370300 [Mycena indigotica]|uniref:Uncharacterized protein n=1 Tax=Mycena indigotica TaxID=2126181 RepID=A0A8H6T335_9AGAR|nr:uncharacterized protein MIND_00370300 [Mycena indigotica]KAF7309975.1 hypothetical protein MIND_00370300 [Mycena indigotica]